MPASTRRRALRRLASLDSARYSGLVGELVRMRCRSRIAVGCTSASERARLNAIAMSSDRQARTRALRAACSGLPGHEPLRLQHDLSHGARGVGAGLRRDEPAAERRDLLDRVRGALPHEAADEGLAVGPGDQGHEEADHGAEQRREAEARVAGDDERQPRARDDRAPHEGLTSAIGEPVERGARQVRIDRVLVRLRVVLHPDRHRQFQA